MPKPKVDKETQKLLSEQEHVKNLTEQEGWGIVKGNLIKYVAALHNISSLNSTDPQAMFNQVASRQLAAGILLEWLKDVEGTAAQFDANKELADQVKGSYIVHFSMEGTQ